MSSDSKKSSRRCFFMSTNSKIAGARASSFSNEDLIFDALIALRLHSCLGDDVFGLIFRGSCYTKMGIKLAGKFV